MTSGIGIAYVDGPRLRRSLLAAAVGRVAAWLGTKLNIKPIMAISREGTVDPVARTRGRAGARRRLLELLDRAIAGARSAVRLGVAHAGIPSFADELAAELMARYRPKQCVVAPITPVIAAHAGIGAWGVFYQLEDGTNG